MEATEKGVEREKEGGSQRLILTMLSASLPACLLKIVFASLGAIHIRQRGRRKAQGLGKVGDAAEEGEAEEEALGWLVGSWVVGT